MQPPRDWPSGPIDERYSTAMIDGWRMLLAVDVVQRFGEVE